MQCSGMIRRLGSLARKKYTWTSSFRQSIAVVVFHSYSWRKEMQMEKDLELGNGLASWGMTGRHS